ncbi:tyrosine-type recombinase/integrase [Schinkia azotoformans]|uniref:tyrosine-type recombinase/integrase n=1 Tax=Schinkia azotoformans TaxID=1454 RepID=UPI002DB6B5FD|nr:tyrosine-type recombinase/integrase [Schinkia azotoformans]MEC1759893.1 tyrosine-type recombinase/integrase [Schinkia azotoformans]
MKLQLLSQFEKYLIVEAKSHNTIKSYVAHVNEYLAWFKESYGTPCSKLYRENILDYKSYLLNVKKYKGKNLNGKTINSKLSSLHSLNKFLVIEGIQAEDVITKSDFIKIQVDYANPCDITKKDVEHFRQQILEAGEKRLYALVTLLAYGGLRITEALNVKLGDYNFTSRELIVYGKGGKQRVVYLNSKIVNSFREYLKVRKHDSEYLFVSREKGKIDRSVINKHFKKFSNKITPHMLRHFYCTTALESGFSIHEVANQAGHRDLKTSLIYTNPSREEMKRKAELL